MKCVSCLLAFLLVCAASADQTTQLRADADGDADAGGGGGGGDGNSKACTAIAGGKKTTFDYLVLKLSWPKTACDAMLDGCAKSKVKDRFVIKGLWPMYNDGSYPVFCRDEKFKMAKISDIQNVMNKYWTDLNGRTEQFVLGDSQRKEWKEQWETHGVCLSKDQHHYFKQALTLRKALPMESYLWAANIYPSNNRAYHAKDIHKAISFGLGGVRPVLMCTPPRTGPNDKSDCYLQEIQICLNKDRVPIDCPTGLQQCAKNNGVTCNGRMVRFPSVELGRGSPPKPPRASFVFLLYIALFIFFYIVGGCVYNIQVQDKKFGVNAIPHLRFWRHELPLLVRDGCMFSYHMVIHVIEWVRVNVLARGGGGPRNIFS